MNTKEIIQRYREERERLGFSQQDVATAVATSRQSISMYEKGHHQPTLKMLVKLLDAVGLELRVVEQAAASTAELEMEVEPGPNPPEPKPGRRRVSKPGLRRTKSPEGPPPPGDPRHGSPYCYSFYGCRCELCCKAKAAGSGRIYH